MKLMMAGRGAEIPENRFVVLRQQCEPADFVLRPTADVRRGKITHVVHVKTQEGSHLGLREKSLSARQTFTAQSIEIDSLFPINRHRSISRQCHGRPPLSLLNSGVLNSHFGSQDRLHKPRATSNTDRSVGTVTSSKGGENGIGTCIAPMRFTGASK